ncbi:Type II secretion system F domain [Ignisphaera aggregans DSM 17230]|uniref:Type II secretion system F domain n=1 Tax=Ignisphaera aggregans (strain DSM 17230 / JCM 13409 / AQ1.S1) TaxID=583356 RepID=E0SRT1_IGNAA|nr:Type II secretion system F domain [Ignisphaera aggregans DSM 17230]
MSIRGRDIYMAIAIAVLMIAIYIVMPSLIAIFIGFDMYRRFTSIKIYISRGAIPFPVLASSATYLLISTIISIASESLYFIYRNRMVLINMLRKQVLDFIPLTSSYVATGASLLTSLEESAKIIGRPLSDYVYRYVEFVKMGRDPVESFDECFKIFPSDLRAILSSIAIAITSGGRVSEMLMYADRYSRQMARLEELRRNRIEGYKAVIFLAIVAFIISAIVTLVLLKTMTRIAIGTPLITGSIDIAEVVTHYYISSIVLIVISSIAISRIVYGDVVHAYKYISIISLLSGIVFSITFLYIF